MNQYTAHRPAATPVTPKPCRRHELSARRLAMQWQGCALPLRGTDELRRGLQALATFGVTVDTGLSDAPVRLFRALTAELASRPAA